MQTNRKVQLGTLQKIKSIKISLYLPVSWLNGSPFVSGAGNLRLKSHTGQMGQSVANGCFDISLKGAVLPGRNDVEISPANSLHV